MKKIEVRVQLRREVLDPQGKAILKVLHGLGYDEVRSVRAGKLLTLLVDDEALASRSGSASDPAASDSGADLEPRAREMVERVLANPVIESYDLRIETVAGSGTGSGTGDHAGTD